MASLYSIPHRILRRWAQAIGLVTMIALLSGGGFAYRLLLANGRAYDGLSIEETQQLANVEQVREQLDAIRSKFEATEAQNQALRQKLRTQPDEGVFLRQLSAIATQAELEIESFRPGRIISGMTHSEMELFLQAHGSYESICKFLATVNEIERVFRISQASIVRSNPKSETCTFEFQIALYFKPAA